MYIEKGVSSLIAIAIVASIASILGVAAYSFLQSSYQLHIQLYRGLPAIARCWNFTSTWLCSFKVLANVYGNVSIATAGDVFVYGYRYLEVDKPYIFIVNTSSRPIAVFISVDGYIYSYGVEVGDVD
jgi:hypothetical protein